MVCKHSRSVCISHVRLSIAWAFNIRPLSFHIIDALCRAFHVLVEWRILDLALSLYGKVVVPLYENFGPDSIGASVIYIPMHTLLTTTKNLSQEYMWVSRLSTHRSSLKRAHSNFERSASTIRTSPSFLSSPRMCPRCSVYPRNSRPSRQSSLSGISLRLPGRSLTLGAESATSGFSL